MSHLATLGSALDERYLISGTHATGGMATIYLATDRRHGRRVAIKVVASDPPKGTGADERFAREIHITPSFDPVRADPRFDSLVRRLRRPRSR